MYVHPIWCMRNNKTIFFLILPNTPKLKSDIVLNVQTQNVKDMAKFSTKYELQQFNSEQVINLLTNMQEASEHKNNMDNRK